MFKYQKFLIRSTDHFDPASYPLLEEKISSALIELEAVPSLYRTEMLVSFLKGQSMEPAWVAGNPDLAELISSKELPLADIEALFESGKGNAAFISELEAYIKQQFTVVPVGS